MSAGPKSLELVERVLQENRYCVVATASPGGEPWVSPVFYNFDERFNLYWESARDSRHSRLIKLNGRVAVCVGSLCEGADPGESLYFEAEAREAASDELARAVQVFVNGPHKRESLARSPDDYAAGKPLGLYVAAPRRIYVLEVGQQGGYEIDGRRELELP